MNGYLALFNKNKTLVQYVIEPMFNDIYYLYKIRRYKYTADEKYQTETHAAQKMKCK